MTTEIAIANKEAVALAADSAVTVRLPDGAKIYNSANKLFELSKHHPVGIMIHGNAQLTGVPWETLIKEYRRKLGDRCFPNLLDYCDDFLRFLNEHADFFSEDDQNEYITFLVVEAIENIREEIRETIADTFGEQSRVSRSEIDQIVDKVIDKHNQTFEKLEMLSCFSENFSNEFNNKYKERFNYLIRKVFDKLNLSKRNRTKLLKIAVNLFVKNYFSPLASGVAIAGFGDKEIFPKLYAYRLDSFFNGQLKYALFTQKCILGGSYPTIVGFGQEDMIYSFIEGIDSQVETLSLVTLNRILENFSEAIIDEVKDLPSVDGSYINNLINKSKANQSKLLDSYLNEMREYRRELHVHPILTTVTFLPKDELGAMAQALVSLTTLKRRVTTDAETVGGPTDVAVISKGDGFIWIDRKHYFRPDLNQSFFQRR